MPKVKAKRNRDESDDEYDASTQRGGTQGAGTQYDRQLASLSEEVKQAKINDLVKYLLIADQKKFPIKKADIIKDCITKEHSKLFSMLMAEAEKRLADVFGIKVVEVEKQKQANTYILVSSLGIDAIVPHQTWSDEENGKMGLIIVILGMIFMNGNIIQDKVLYHALDKLGLEKEHAHEVFGDISKFLTRDLPSQGWLEYTTLHKGTEQEYNEFSWGPRAKAEATKRNILDFMCQVYGNKPQEWTSQWQDVVASEPHNANLESNGASTAEDD